MSVFKTLYRRGSNFLVATPEVVVGSGLTYTWTFTNPGWIAFDFMCNVPFPQNGELPNKWFTVTVDGVRRFRVRAGWAWTRNYIFVDSGTHTVRFYTESYGSGDSAKIRRVELTNFPKMNEFKMMESVKFPKPLETIQAFSILRGWQRYQRTGVRGASIEFNLIFESIPNWKRFMKDLEDFYIIKGDFGVYGGVLTPQDVETVTKGSLIIVKCNMLSPMTAGVGVDGE